MVATTRAAAGKIQMELIDLFCGGGLFSFAARDAGMIPTFAVDNDAAPLNMYKLNFPGATVRCAELGPNKTEVELPPPTRNRHIHLSPECREVSSANTSCTDSSNGEALLGWSIDLGVTHYSYSVETVDSSKTRRVVAAAVARHGSELVSSVFLDAASLGDPQTRRRLIIGRKGIIDRLKEAPGCEMVSVRMAFAEEGLEIPKEATHVKNSSAVDKNTLSNVRTIDQHAFTVCAARALSFCSADGTTKRSMSAQHSRVVMGFPKSLRLVGGCVELQRAIGNGVTFNTGRVIALAAMGKPITFKRKAPPATAAPTRALEDEEEEVDLHKTVKYLLKRDRELRNRLADLEEALLFAEKKPRM